MRPAAPVPGGVAVAVAVAVLTYRRPRDLEAVLPELEEQIRHLGAAAEVVVVDNDPGASARELVRTLAPDGVRYVHEPRPGIAAARNRALDEARGARLLVFIDDDERPSRTWLQDLLRTHDRTGATAVVGPVVSEFAAPVDPWVRAGGFFDRRRLPTGTPVSVAATNNLLLDVAEVQRLDLRFDERFGLSGGSDTLFTRQLSSRGGTMVWCDEALVTDVVPLERLTRRWVLARALRSGNGWSRTALALVSTRRARVRLRAGLSARGTARLLAGAGRLLLGVAQRDQGHQARGARTLARGAGMVSGAFGYTYVEYRRTRTRAAAAPVRPPGGPS